MRARVLHDRPMDVQLYTSPVYALPSSLRVGALVWGGAADLRLWPGPGSDRELLHLYGPTLRATLDTERRDLPSGRLQVGELLRLHPGRLHTDMLLWAAVREPEPGTERAPAASLERLQGIVHRVLEFVADRRVVRVAFPALGEGTGEGPAVDRLEAIVRAVHEHRERWFVEGRASGVEEVLICDASSAAIAEVRRRTAALVREVRAVRRQESAREETPRTRSASSRSSSRPRRSAKRMLDPSELARQRFEAKPYDRAHAYGAGEWLRHATFGIGRVEQALAGGTMVVLFEDGEQRKLVYGR